MSTPVNPLQNAQQAPANPFIQQAQQTFSNPAASAVPQQQGIAGLANHPIVQAILKAISSGAGAYGWTSMPPQQRLESQQLEQQKAEAMARLGMQGQQLGIEQQRANTEATGVRQTGEYQRGELAESGKRTAIASRQADIEAQRMQNEHDKQVADLKREAEQATAEYGPGGLRSRQVGASESQARSESTRAAADARLADIADRREKAEKEYQQGVLKNAGQKDSRDTLEQERKARIAAATEIYSRGGWYETKSGLRDAAQKKVNEINKDIDTRMAALGGDGTKPQPEDTVTVISNGVRGTMPRGNLAAAQKRDPKLQVVQ